MTSDTNGPNLTKEQREVLLIEYQKAQDSAQHHDTLVWTITSLNWVGSAILMGFVLGKIGIPCSQVQKIALLSISIVGIALSALVWLWANRTRYIKLDKYKRCQEIEAIFGMKQHSQLQYKAGSQNKEYAVLMALFLSAWIILIFILITSEP